MRDKNNLRIVYMGTPEFAVAPLKTILENNYNVVGVVTVPDKPKGRGLQLAQSDVKRFVLDYNQNNKEGNSIPILQPEKLRDELFLKELSELNADLFIVVAFRMLPECVWQMPKLGTFNLHASLLPKYRGAAPINWAIINREKESGVTTFFLDKEIDTGEIILQEKISLHKRETINTLYEKLMQIGAKVVIKTIENILEEKVVTKRQGDILKELDIKDDSICLKAPKINRDTCTIDWRKMAEEIDAQVRGLSYPGCIAKLCKKENHQTNPNEESIDVKIFMTELDDKNLHSSNNLHFTNNHECGEIKIEDSKFLVMCSNGWIEISQLQLAGKKRMTAQDFLRGFRDIEKYHFATLSN